MKFRQHLLSHCLVRFRDISLNAHFYPSLLFQNSVSQTLTYPLLRYSKICMFSLNTVRFFYMVDSKKFVWIECLLFIFSFIYCLFIQQILSVYFVAGMGLCAKCVHVFTGLCAKQLNTFRPGRNTKCIL